MTLFQKGAIRNSAAFATDQLDLLLTVPALSCLHRFEIHGVLNSAATAPGLGTGDFVISPRLAGIQFGASGYGGVRLTSGNDGGNSWVTFGDVVQGWHERTYLAGASRIADVDMSATELRVSWRGTLFIPSARDYYFAAGCNPSQLFAFGLNYTWYCEYSQ